MMYGWGFVKNVTNVLSFFCRNGDLWNLGMVFEGRFRMWYMGGVF